MRERRACGVRFSRSLSEASIHERPQYKVLTPEFPLEPYSSVCVCISLDLYVQATACDSMAQLMNKLDQLSEGIQDVQSADSSDPDDAHTEQEQQSSVVSKAQFTTSAEAKDRIVIKENKLKY